MFDIHTHLYWKSYAADRESVIVRAREAGLRAMFVVGCDIEESRAAIALARSHADIFAAVGMHPHEFTGEKRLQTQKTDWQNALRELAHHARVVAVGECGLDYYAHGGEPVSEGDKQAQKEAFETQIGLAAELGLPVIVHCRTSATPGDDAYRDLLPILARHPETGFVLHCYMGDTEVTSEFLFLQNVSFSFTGNITYPVKQALCGTKDDLTETVKQVPLERLFVETDCPFLAPQSRRGERNEPAFVLSAAEKACELHGITLAALDNQLSENLSRIFPRARGA